MISPQSYAFSSEFASNSGPVLLLESKAQREEAIRKGDDRRREGKKEDKERVRGGKWKRGFLNGEGEEKERLASL